MNPWKVLNFFMKSLSLILHNVGHVIWLGRVCIISYCAYHLISLECSPVALSVILFRKYPKFLYVLFQIFCVISNIFWLTAIFVTFNHMYCSFFLTKSYLSIIKFWHGFFYIFLNASSHRNQTFPLTAVLFSNKRV